MESSKKREIPRKALMVSVRGHVVKMADADPLYHMIHSINNGTARLIVAADHQKEKEANK